jgi:hypothetical protein
MAGLTYDGVVSVPSPGGAVTMLELSMNSLALSGSVTMSVTQAGQTVTIRASQAVLSNSVVLYTTKISGDLNGVPLTYTPASPPASLPSSLQLTSLVVHALIAGAGAALISNVRTTIS